MTNSTNNVISISFADSIKQLENLKKLSSSAGGNAEFACASLLDIIDNVSTRARKQGAFRQKDMQYISQILDIVARYQDITADALNLKLAFNMDKGAKLDEDKNI